MPFYYIILLSFSFIKRTYGFLPSSLNLSCSSLLDASCVLAYNQSTSLVRMARFHAGKVLGEFGAGGGQGCGFYMLTCEVDC